MCSPKIPPNRLLKIRQKEPNVQTYGVKLRERTHNADEPQAKRRSAFGNRCRENTDAPRFASGRFAMALTEGSPDANVQTIFDCRKYRQ